MKANTRRDRLGALAASLVVIAVGAAMLFAAGPASAAPRPRTTRPPARFRAPKPKPKPRPYRPAPLAATVTAVGDTGVASITGGTAPFTVTLVADTGILEPVYTGTARSVTVPLMPGPTEFAVTDARGMYATASALGDISIWVVDNTARSALRYDTLVETVTVSVAVRGDEATANVALRNISVRPTDDHAFVVVADALGGSTNNRLIQLDPTGAVDATIPIPSSYRLQDVTFDDAGNIYTIDRGLGYFAANRVRIVKLDPTGNVLDSTETVLPSNGFTYPMANLTNMIEYQPTIGRLVARINTGTFAIIDPATLAIESYRYSADYAYTCMTLDSDTTTASLYTGGSGFNRPAFFGRQIDWLTDTKYADASIINTATVVHSWITTPTLPAIADVSVDSSHYVYTVQRDDANKLFGLYVVDPGGSEVTTVALPYGQKLSVVR
jgi:hypothetical protein